jgi:hypothetical protein
MEYARINQQRRERRWSTQKQSKSKGPLAADFSYWLHY